MQKFLFFFFLPVVLPVSLLAQKVSGHPRFSQGNTITITTEIKNTVAQQAGGQAIDFSTQGGVLHTYTVTNTTEENTTLHHRLQRLHFGFEGMGQESSFDSDDKKALQSAFGKLFLEMQAKQYDMIIDVPGTTLLTIPQKIELGKQDDRLVIITNMLKDLTNVIYPPQKGAGSFFKVLPAYEVGIGDSWVDTTITDSEKAITVSTLTAITDSTLIVSFKTNSTVLLEWEMMGTSAKTNLNNTTTGTTVVDKATGLIRERTSTTESNGNTEAMGAVLPLTGKTTITTRVAQGQVATGKSK